MNYVAFFDPVMLDGAESFSKYEMAADGFSQVWRGPVQACFCDGWLYWAAVWKRDGAFHWGYVSDGTAVVFGYVDDVVAAQRLASNAAETCCRIG